MTGGLSGSLEGNDILSKYSAMTGEPATFFNIIHYIFIENYGFHIILGCIVLYLVIDYILSIKWRTKNGIRKRNRKFN
jgi:hypothetical protein